MLLPCSNRVIRLFLSFQGRDGNRHCPFSRISSSIIHGEYRCSSHVHRPHAWLILGVPVTGGLLYREEFEKMQDNEAFPGQLEVTYAISREMKNAAGGKLYVQDVLTRRAEDLFQRLDNGAVIYFCGLKGMMPGILDALEQVATQRGINWNARLNELKANHQWHVEVY